MISGTRAARILEKVSKAIFQSGRAPTNADIERELRANQDILDSTKPSMQFRPFPFRSRMDLGRFNSMMLEIGEDLDYLYDEQLAQAIRLLKMLNQNEVFFKALDRQIRVIDSQLQDVVLTTNNAEALLFAISDTLVDARNIDQSQSTVSLDFDKGVATLPANAGGVKRIPMSHLDGATGWAITVRDSDNAIVTETSASVGVSPDPISRVPQRASDVKHESQFGNAFGDLINAWQFSVVRERTDPTSIEFVVPIVPQNVQIPEIALGRIDVDPAVGSAVMFEIFHSLDNANFKHFIGHETPILTDIPFTMRFPEILVQYVRVRMTKNRPDEVRPDGKAVYTFGLKNFAFFTMGYAREGFLYTTALVPQDSASMPAISRVTLSADEIVPADTEIDYFVALNQTPIQFQQISNLQRLDTDAPQVLRFAGTFDSPRQENRFEITTTPSIQRSRNGVSFYNIYPSVKSGHQFRTSRLYRGIGGWHKQRVTEIRDKGTTNEITFDSNLDRKLYLLVQNEEATLISFTVDSDTLLAVGSDLSGGSSSDSIFDASGDRRPNYPVESVFHHPDDLSFTGVTSDPLGVNQLTITISEVVDLRKGDRISVTSIGVDVSGLELVVDAVDNGSSTTLVVDIPTGVTQPASFTSGTLTVTRQDVTRHVTKFKGTDITLGADADSNFVVVATDDRFEVTYHKPFGLEHDLLTPDISVTDGDTKVYANGVDFELDPLKKTITRLLGGEIPDVGTVTVNLPYRERTVGLEIYSTYVRVGSTVDVEIDDLNLDRESGESATIFIDNEAVDIDSDGLPKILPGIYQFRVRSLPVTDAAGHVQKESAIYKVVNVATTGGQLLFTPERFFQTQDAFIEPMTQTSLTRLIGSVRKSDHGFFAIEENTVVVNFNPIDGEEVIYLAPGASQLTVKEAFELTYRYVPSPPATNEVLLKIRFRRKMNKPDTTPVLQAFSIRFA